MAYRPPSSRPRCGLWSSCRQGKVGLPLFLLVHWLRQIRPGAYALIVVRPHLRVVLRVVGQVRERTGQVIVSLERASTPQVTSVHGLVAQVVVGDGRLAGHVRRTPCHVQRALGRSRVAGDRGRVRRGGRLQDVRYDDVNVYRPRPSKCPAGFHLSLLSVTSTVTLYEFLAS